MNDNNYVKDKFVKARIDALEYRELYQTAKKNGINMSTIIRRGIKLALKELNG